MAKLALKLIGIAIFLVAALEAQETPAAESSPASQSAGETSPTTEGSSTGEITQTTVAGSEVTGSPTNSTNPSDPPGPENGGDPFVKPGNHIKGPRHVRAHDGFHNLKTEKHWARWNDAFTTPGP
ncbi:uncharacterized protein LOC6548967 [Drosophila erecta]|uniref:Uncharacterized protein n=1 Tax=Drosophila erecta TaxID=7220 RepID=B3NL21_DROER|nr:uncharacterized protein LOC6548967 [Drosophila erecta]EDV54599.1 uncharacterized protein Dere_GG21602 [Drosophila erecta]